MQMDSRYAILMIISSHRNSLQSRESCLYEETFPFINISNKHSPPLNLPKLNLNLPDANFILSGSDDGNVRLWRAHASKREGIKSARQRQKLEYDEAIKERYGHMPEIRRIKRHRHVPKQVKKAGEIKAEELASIKRRRENERKHSKKGQVPRRPEREKMVLGVEQ